MHTTEKFWDRMSNVFDMLSKRIAPIYGKAGTKARRYLKADDIVLDYACATGIVACEIAGSVKHIHAIDISSKMIEAAKRRSREKGIVNIDFAHTTLFDETYTQGCFDIVLAFNILHLLDDTQKALQRINELLKPGGVIVSSTVCLGEGRTIAAAIAALLMKAGLVPRARFFKIAELEDVIVQENFRILEADSVSRRPLQYFIAAKKQDGAASVPA